MQIYPTFILLIGVCPQQNVIFDFMTVQEHLEFYYGLKGIAPNARDAKVTIDHFTVMCLVAWHLNESAAGVDLACLLDGVVLYKRHVFG